jgi:uncharacterized membrane-anchored protein YhcB (DUF1043 family)
MLINKFIQEIPASPPVHWQSFYAGVVLGIVVGILIIKAWKENKK